MNDKIIGTQNLNKTIIILIIPVMIEMLLETMLGYVNTSMLGRLDITGYLTATDLTNQITMTCLVLANAFSLGGTVLVSKYIGARDEINRNKAIAQTINFAVIFSFISYFILTQFSTPFLIKLGAQNTEVAPVLTYAQEYMKIMIYTVPILMFRQMFVGILRGMGKTILPMFLSGVNITLNIFFNFYFIYYRGLGLQGAAYSTLISRGISLIILILFFAKLSNFNLKLKDFIFTRLIVKDIIAIGAPTALEMLIFRFGMMYYYAMIIPLGPIATDAHSVANATESFSYTPGSAFNVVIVTLVGQFLGAKKYDMAKECIKKTDRLAIIFMGTFGLLFLTTPFIFTSLFTSNKDVIVLASKIIRIEALAQVFFARYYVYSGLMRTIGKAKQVFFVSSSSVWLIRIPIAYVLINYSTLGLVGAWIGMCLDYVYRAFFITLLVKYYMKKFFTTTLKPRRKISLFKRRRKAFNH